MSIEIVITIAKVAMTAYSAYSAIVALKEGNILGAVVAGFGAYMGASALMSGAGGATVGSTSGAISEGAAAAAGEGVGTLASDVGGSFAVEGGSQLAGGGASAFTTSAPTLAAMPSGAGVAVGGVSDLAMTGGMLNSAASVVPQSVDDAVGQTTINASGDVVDQAGNVFDQLTGAIKEAGTGVMDFFGSGSGTTLGMNNDLLKAGTGVLGYAMNSKAEGDRLDAAKDSEDRMFDEAERVRSSRGAAPSFQYRFGLPIKEAGAIA